MRLGRRIITAGDPLIGIMSLVAAYALCNNGTLPEFDWRHVGLAIVTFLLISEGTFVAMGMYRRLWRYASIRDLTKIVAGVTASQIIWAIVLRALSIPLSIYVQAAIWLIFLTGVAGLRLAFRVRDEILISIGRRSQSSRVLIAGAGQTGAQVLRDIMRDPSRRYDPVALVDDDVTKQGMDIYGIPVRGTLAQIKPLMDDLGIDEIILAMPSAPKSVLRQMLANCREWGVPLKIASGLNEPANGPVSKGQIREVRVEDLLGREPVQLDLDEISGYLHGKRVLVTGAGGSIGSEICRLASRFHPELLILMGRGENSIFEIEQEMRSQRPDVPIYPVIGDIRDQTFVDRLFADLSPHVVFHAAAHKHVPLMEAWPGEAVKNNVFGTYHVIAAAERYKAERFVLLSTDKAVNPANIMGATKRAAELIMQAHARMNHGTIYTAVRFGNVLGSRGSVVPHFKQQIARGGPVTITHPEMTRYFMTIPEAVQLVIQAGAMARGGEIFVLDMGEPVKITDLADNMIRLSGLEPGRDIAIEFTGPRPGEKLAEEILTAEEGTRATQNSRIYMANMPELTVPSASLNEVFYQLVAREDVAGTRAFIEDHILKANTIDTRIKAVWPDEAAAAIARQNDL